MIFYVQKKFDVKSLYMRCKNILRVVPMTTFLDERSNTLLYSRENKIKFEGYYCRDVLSGAAMAPPALHLRENTGSRRQGRRHGPLGRTIGGLDQQRANGSQYNADRHLPAALLVQNCFL